ncbi:MAG TPA: DUF1553 domain-containing protein, partial [Pirellulaceae bacterium]|nr:DUF1553 domain-containing protein [Pirellulaceae bacterium]
NYTGSPDIHRLEFIHDGFFGNSHSWIASTASDSWVQFEFPEMVVIDSMVWSRDRSGQPNAFSDRLAIEYTVDLSLDGVEWRRVASSQDRLGSHDLAVLTPDASDEERAKIAERIAQLSERRLKLTEDLASMRKHPTVYAGRFETPPPTFRLHRGGHRMPREAVQPQSLSAFANSTSRFELADDATNAERRVALAHWLTQTDNPLPARVIVNRLWQGVFGTGLVATPSDFGNLGARPSHPELLDMLACDFIENGWSMKRTLRLLLTSKTFRQSSQPRTEGLNLDADSRLLWRYPPQRMPAEMIRDSLLSASGALDLTAGGPGFLLFEPNDNYARNWVPKTVFEPADYRRMIYALKIRMEPDAIFSAFDVPDGGQVCPQRPMSITPIQALNLFNSQFVIDEAHRLASALIDDSRSVEEQIEKAFMRVLLRPPDDVERQWASELATEHSLAAVVRALFNSNEFLWIE